MIILPRSVYFHIPKTGGTWTRHALKVAVKDFLEDVRPPLTGHWYNLRLEHISPANAPKELLRDKFLFTFVRNPITWYQSTWAQRNDCGWSDPDVLVIDRLFKGSEFNEFVLGCMERFPGGMLTRIYKEFTGEDLQRVDYIGKQENLRQDLITALTKAKEGFNAEIIKNMAQLNVISRRAGYGEKRKYRREVFEKLLEYEKWVFDSFGYKPIESEVIK